MELFNPQTTKEETISQGLSNLTTEESDKHSTRFSQDKRHSKYSQTSAESQETKEEADLSDEEVKLSIVNDIRQEIVQTALDLIYENYLEKQTVYFVSHCSRLAWRALVDWNFQKKDRGDYVQADQDRSDQEPLPSPKDSWAGHSVPIGPEYQTRCKTKPSESKATEFTPTSSVISHLSSRIGTVNTEPHTNVTKGRMLKQKKFIERGSNVKKSEEFGARVDTKSTTKADDLKKESYELPSPVQLQTKHFPSVRVEVQYAIMPGNPSKGNNLASKNELKTKTIVLKKENEKEKPKTKDA